ncbi:choice-of-anchor Q domain-containing protein [Dysgonomonas sp. 25]|uniref:choice-of-anchor Q domain-containing protein n=1 Tax=Dysgonomonas sp. 25 TaxID=2302933 RepID=UPI00351AFC73
MKSIKYILFVPLLFLSLFYACTESDDFSGAPDLKLTFGRDTISFDTVFTTVGSSTQYFKIYNRNNKSLTIESIEIVNPQQSGFRMNIDGEPGTRITNVDILRKDSLFGFLQVTVDPLNANNPVLIRDSIRFVTNGNVQYVYLEAIGRDVHKWKGKTFSADTTLTATKPYLVYDSIRVDNGATLTIKEGVELYFHDKASVQVYGELDAQGLIRQPVIFRGDRLDYYNGNIPYDRVSGLWQGIVFHPQSYNNRLENVIVRNTVTGLKFLPSNTSNKKASLRNAIIHNASENVLTATDCDIDAVNCQLTNARMAVLDLDGGKYSFLHCTIANYYRFSPRFEQAVVLKDETGSMQQCDFINSIVYGSLSSELGINTSLTNYQFINCLIKNKEELSNSHFVSNYWNLDPKFVLTGTNQYYECDFSLQASSAAKDKANAAYSASAPNDLRGISRLSDSAPDIGCYEWYE